MAGEAQSPGGTGPSAGHRRCGAAFGARPRVGRRRPDLLGGPYRFWSLIRFSYLLVYDPQTDPVQILRLLHTKRDLPRALADLAEQRPSSPGEPQGQTAARRDRPSD